MDALIGELRRKLDQMQKKIMVNRQRISEQASRVDRFKAELEACVKNVQNPTKLKESFLRLYHNNMQVSFFYVRKATEMFITVQLSRRR